MNKAIYGTVLVAGCLILSVVAGCGNDKKSKKEGCCPAKAKVSSKSKAPVVIREKQRIVPVVSRRVPAPTAAIPVSSTPSWETPRTYVRKGNTGSSVDHKVYVSAEIDQEMLATTRTNHVLRLDLEGPELENELFAPSVKGLSKNKAAVTPVAEILSDERTITGHIDLDEGPEIGWANRRAIRKSF